MSFGVVLDEVFVEHRNPAGHPERPERIRALIEALAEYPGPVSRFEPRPIDERHLLAVHAPEYVNRIRATQGLRERDLDPDTHTSPRSYEVACLAAGSAIRLLELIREGRIQAGFSLARPPGHHATRNRAMGFCLFNNAAVAAEWAIHEQLARRVAIFDFDVHHGNGTQEIFWTRSDVLYISSHQFPHYPGTGAFSEVGAGPGRGFTVNFPVPAGRDDAFFVRLYNDLAKPVVREFKPDLIIVSAGYDAHTNDPLAGMRMTREGFGAITSSITGVAREQCQGRVLFVLEGGYHLKGLTDGVLTTIDAVLGRRDFTPLYSRQSREFEAYREIALPHLRAHWKLS
ncbi:MAG: histone deacetylase [Acidobacteriota bacterium]